MSEKTISVSMGEELLKSGKLEPITDIAQRITGERPSRPTMWRWTRKGCRGVVLPAQFAMNGWRTTEAAFRWFIAQRTEVMLQPRATATVPSVDDDALHAAGLL